MDDFLTKPWIVWTKNEGRNNWTATGYDTAREAIDAIQFGMWHQSVLTRNQRLVPVDVTRPDPDEL